MTTSADLRQAVVTALAGATDAGANVFSALDWPTWDGQYPVLYIQVPSEDKESLGRQGGQQFTVTLTLSISARVRVAPSKNGVGAAAAVVALEKIQRQVEVALINNPTLTRQTQQMPFVRSTMKVDGSGSQDLGELVMDVGLEFYQGPEDFYPIPADPLERLTVDADLENVADRTGTYANPLFPGAVHPAPRPEGPDGRAEGGLDINLPS